MSSSLLEVSELPHWSRVDFATRCALTVKPLFLRYAPDVEPEYVQTLDRILLLLAESIMKARAADTLDDEYGKIWEAAGAVLVETGTDLETGQQLYTPDSVIASYAAKTIEMAMETALSDPESLARSAWSGFRFAWLAAEAADDQTMLAALDAV